MGQSVAVEQGPAVRQCARPKPYQSDGCWPPEGAEEARNPDSQYDEGHDYEQHGSPSARQHLVYARTPVTNIADRVSCDVQPSQGSQERHERVESKGTSPVTMQSREGSSSHPAAWAWDVKNRSDGAPWDAKKYCQSEEGEEARDDERPTK